MNTIELNLEKKRACEKDRFCSFVEKNDEFSREEVKHLRAVILKKKLSRILYVSASLAVWSMIAAWVDAVILPFIIIYTIALPGHNTTHSCFQFSGRSSMPLSNFYTSATGLEMP
jgi:hypothetical protein